MKGFGRSAKRGKSRNEEGYGRGEASIAAGDDVLLDEDAMVEMLLACLNAPTYEPPTLPAVAVELMSLAQRSDVDIDDVVGLLEQDSLIAGRVLKIAQSPVYAGAVAVDSLRECMMRLGLATLRDEVMKIAMNLKVFRSQEYADPMEGLRRHSTMTAHFAKVVAKHAAGSVEYAFLAGLLHDVGIAGTLLALSELRGRQKPPDLISVWPAVDRVHPRAAEIMAAHWDLPDEIREGIGLHHQVLKKGEVVPLAAVVAVANELAHEEGFGVIPKADDEAASSVEEACAQSHHAVDRSLPKTIERSREALELGDAEMDRIRSDIAALESPFS